MPITVAHDVDPYQLGQAGLAIGNYEGNLQRQHMALQQLAMLQRMGGSNATGGQQDYNLGNPARGAISEGAVGQDPSVDPVSQSLNASQNVDAENAAANQPLDPQSQATLDETMAKHKAIDQSDYLTDDEKNYAHQQVDLQHQLGNKFNPPKYQQPFSESFQQNSHIDPNSGATIYRDASGKTHVIPAGQQDQSDGWLPDTNGDGSHPSPDDAFSQSTHTDDKGNVYTQTKNGWKLLAKAPAAAKAQKEDLSLPEYERMFRQMKSETDDDGNPLYKNDDEIDAAIQSHVDRHKKLTSGKTSLGTPTPEEIVARSTPQNTGAPQNTYYGGTSQQAAQGGGSPPMVQSADDHAQLPRGAHYRDPQGNLRVKQ